MFSNVIIITFTVFLKTSFYLIFNMVYYCKKKKRAFTFLTERSYTIFLKPH